MIRTQSFQSLPFDEPAIAAPSVRTGALLGVATFCAAAGLLTIFSSARSLFGIWSTDELKSMGLLVPFISFALVLRAWRKLDWVAEGSWWGLALLAASALLVFLRDQMLLIVTVNNDWLLQIPPLPVVAVLYAAGLVLLFGGMTLLRASVFPVLLMLAVIPVPQTFSRRVDLPLQHVSATVARSFAHALGQTLTEDRLRLMFTPEFGMFIAPGCNGIRGAVTLGLAALVVSYLYRFSWYMAAPAIAGAVLLGYICNFARLCLLVLYYKIALPYPLLQRHAKTADYLIGGALFLTALVIFFAVANRLRRDRDIPAPERAMSPARPARLGPTFLRAGALLALSAIFGVDALHTVHAEAVARAAVAPLPSSLPLHIGQWARTRTWTDTMTEGTVVYLWAEYAQVSEASSAENPVRVALGISPVLGVHDAEVCHIARGENPTWHGQLQLASARGAVSLTGATYNNGRVQKLEASTVCDGGVCGQFSHSYGQTAQHVTLVYGRPHRNLPVVADADRPVPVLLKVETTDTMLPVKAAEPKLAEALASFLQNADLPAIAAPYARR